MLSGFQISSLRRRLSIEQFNFVDSGCINFFLRDGGCYAVFTVFSIGTVSACYTLNTLDALHPLSTSSAYITFCTIFTIFTIFRHRRILKCSDTGIVNTD